MNQNLIWVFIISSFLTTQVVNSLDGNSKRSLFNFLVKLSTSSGQPDQRFNFNWNLSTDPCEDSWDGVYCEKHRDRYVTKLVLDNLNLSGVFDDSLVCNVEPLASSVDMISFTNNNVNGEVSGNISSCKQLSRLHVSGNNLSGTLPETLSSLKNLKTFEVSDNGFTGDLPDMSMISGLKVFLVQDNRFTGGIPGLDFENLESFNVSHNNLTGPIPDVHGKFHLSCFLGNPGLCGDPMKLKCSNQQPESIKLHSKTQIFMYSGYIGLVVLALVGFILCKLASRKKKPKDDKDVKRVVDTMAKPNVESNEYKPEISVSKSGFSVNSTEIAPEMVSSSLVVLTSPMVYSLKFEDLLKAPAELLGRGKQGTLYKVTLENGTTLVVKRIKDWAISGIEFKQRMQRLDQVKHPNVLPALAFYCSKQEKLLVYEYQHNGSLFKLLHGTEPNQKLDWSSRLNVASKIAEALLFMHKEVNKDNITHGNLKSSNILFNNNMEPCLSEYGLTTTVNNGPQDPFKSDIHGLGVVLLELLTGKIVQLDGVDLPTWVHVVVREEWTVEVFDKCLIREGASEERMVNLLRIAIKCVNDSVEGRPRLNQVVTMINVLKRKRRDL